MPRLLNRMPFPKDAGELVVRGGRVRVRADQIVAWISLSRLNLSGPNRPGVPFPVILDTGHNHSFSISERHLNDWAGLTTNSLESRSAIRDRGLRIPLRVANVWIHPNAASHREALSEAEPYRLQAKFGIAVYPGGDFPRLPLLGLRAIVENGLVLHVDGPRREATLRTPHRWPFR